MFNLVFFLTFVMIPAHTQLCVFIGHMLECRTNDPYIVWQSIDLSNPIESFQLNGQYIFVSAVRINHSLAGSALARYCRDFDCTGHPMLTMVDLLVVDDLVDDLEQVWL